MPYRINSIRLQGIRGFNKAEEITLGEGITLVHGQNGSGKSSLLQAIEWALIGNIPYMKKGDFAREDAIVNLFTKSKKANVEVKLGDGGDPITVTRTRKMSTKTSTGKQPLEVQVGDKTLSDEDAEAELERILKISLENFPQTKVLHQETLREVLYAAQEERSQAIDKLLGTYEVREFAKTLDADLQLNKAAARATETIDDLQRDKVQFLLNLKRDLEQTKTTLLNTGHNEDDLTLSSSAKNLQGIQKRADELIRAYNKTPREINIEPSISTLLQAHKAQSSYITEIDRARLEAMSKINDHRNTLQTDSTRYRDLRGRFEGMKDIEPTVMNARVAEIDEELKKLGSQKKVIRLKVIALPQTKTKYESAELNLKAERNALTEQQIKHGSTDEIASKITGGEKRLKEIASELEKLSGQQRLITLAIERLETTKDEICPVCSQGINNTALVKDLRSKVSEKLTLAASDLRGQEKKIRGERAELDAALREHKRLIDAIKTLEAALAKAIEELRKIVPDFEQHNLDDLLKSWEGEVTQLSGRETEFTGERDGLNDTLRRFSELFGELDTLQLKLQKETSSQKEGAPLIGEIERLITTLQTEAERYMDTTAVDSLHGKLSTQSDVLTYLRDEEKVEEAEKELPTVQKQIEDLEARRSSLQAFAASLQSIRQVSTQYQKEASMTQLKRLEDSINEYYTRIQGHPHFTRLKIDVEKEDPLIFSFRAMSDQEDTYIPTRFSTAQLNAVALSIFLSNSDQQAGDFPLILLDDPTQNMDAPHKEAFARLIATLPPKHQVIVATEDDETRTLLEKHCKDIRTYELSDWTTEGPKIKIG
jgi:exonuclease SbcC